MGGGMKKEKFFCVVCGSGRKTVSEHCNIVSKTTTRGCSECGAVTGLTKMDDGRTGYWYGTSSGPIIVDVPDGCLLVLKRKPA